MTQYPVVPGVHVEYRNLNAKQQEIFNYQKVSALLADYGYACIKLSDDWKGADFLADHFSTEKTLRVQLKSCLTIDKKYIDRNIHMTFPVHGTWYLVHHEELLDLVKEHATYLNTKSWQDNGIYFTTNPNRQLIASLKPFALVAPATPARVAPGKNAKAAKGGSNGPILVRVGREVVGPMAQNRAALTAISATAELATVAMEDLCKFVGKAALRAVEGTHTGDRLWAEFCRAHDLDPAKKAQWFIDAPVFRDGQTWIVQYNVWSRAKLEKLAEGMTDLTSGEVEIVFEN